MSAIKDLFLERYQDTLDQAAAQIASILRTQVPVDTGRLQRSITWRVTGDNRISITYNGYGVYTDFGTGVYADQGAYGTDPFELPRFAGYRPGRMGIQPQYWTSLNGQNALIDFLITEIAENIEASISTTSGTRTA